MRLINLLKKMARYLDDILFLAGAVLICIGTHNLCPVATWFVAGAFCIVGGVMWGRALIGGGGK